MEIKHPSEHDRILEEVAQDYRERGYQVLVEPPPNNLPEFLREFRPDLVAVGPNESVVAEVKVGQEQEAENWGRLARLVQEHPGWRFEIVRRVRRGPDPDANLDRSEIETRLHEARTLAQQGMSSAGLLLAWSAAEAAMRLALEQHAGISDRRPRAVLTRLYMDGLLNRGEYDELQASLDNRNAIAHGFSGGRADAGGIDRLERLVRQLLRDRATSAPQQHAA